MESPRSSKLVIGLCIVSTILVGKLFYIQIVNKSFKTDAMNNSMVYKTVYPPRGVIYDRNGQILVDNSVSYDIMVTPREVQPFDTLALASLLEMDVQEIRDKMQEYRTYRSRIGWRTLVFRKRLTGEKYLRFAELEYRFPGFSSQQRTTRHYPFNAGGNLLGYISEVDADYLAKHPEYRSGDYVGKTGLEGANEERLRGEKGYRIFLRDSRNKVLDRYENGEYDKPAVPGQDIHTTVDAALQQFGQSLMEQKRGSVIAIEPSTGEILALVSSPGINIDILSDFSSHFDSLSRDPGKPMFNRAVQASYPPGSVFKLVNGLIGLQEGVLSPEMKYPCYEGFYYGKGRKLGCHSHRSPVNFYEAVMMSCNAYFCFVLKSILESKRYRDTEEAFSKWEEYVRSFGFGSPLGCDMPGELGGNIPTAEVYDKIYGKGHWKFETVVSLSIGQGEIGVTPLQMANLAATIANRGWYITPHIVRDSTSEYSTPHYTKVEADKFEKTVDGMWMAVNRSPQDGATASLAAVKGLDICGKTGTAENPHGADHSVFICFAPRENPKIAVAVYIENAGFGATWACPVASLMVEQYLNGEIGQSRKWLEERVRTANLLNVQKKPKKGEQ